MTVTFDKKSGWEYCGSLFVLEDDFRNVYLGTLRDIKVNKYYKIIYHNTKTLDGKSVTDRVYVADKLKLVKHKNGDITVKCNRMFSEVGMTFLI